MTHIPDESSLKSSSADTGQNGYFDFINFLLTLPNFWIIKHSAPNTSLRLTNESIVLRNVYCGLKLSKLKTWHKTFKVKG